MSPASYQTAPPRVAVSCYSLLRSGKRDSNRRPQPWQGSALPTELFPRRAKSNRPVGYLPPCQRLTVRPSDRPSVRPDGGEGDRTPDLVNAIHALSQLSYAPAILRPPKRPETPDGNTASYRSVRKNTSELQSRFGISNAV